MKGRPIPLRMCSTNKVLHDFPLLLTKLTTSNFLQIHFFFFILKVFNRQEGYISTKSVLCISLNFAMIITGFHLFILGFIMPDNFDSYLLKLNMKIFHFNYTSFFFVKFKSIFAPLWFKFFHHLSASSLNISQNKFNKISFFRGYKNMIILQYIYVFLNKRKTKSFFL